jgi:hypothetical protein
MKQNPPSLENANLEEMGIKMIDNTVEDMSDNPFQAAL